MKHSIRNDITREMVEKTLKETIEEITKCCGGKIEMVGITSAETH